MNFRSKSLKYLKLDSILSLGLLFLLFLTTFTSCGLYKKTNTREVSTIGEERARKNLDEGRGISLKGLGGNRSTTYQFSSSNPMWRASLETLDFLPLSVVDYSGGVLITDWYTDETNSNSSIKISLRFLSNEIRADSLKITIHEKKCSTNINCTTRILSSKIKEELLSSIIKKAAILEKESKKK
tara:strand:+ start:115 stop:666 length:552 start_codon:yes stop_codon:yes gene_type:complete